MSAQTAVTRRKPRRTGRYLAANFMLAVIGAEGGFAIAFGLMPLLEPTSISSGSAITDAAIALSRVTAMAGTYLALVTLLLAARIPWLEREIGQDRLISWHRKLAPYSLYLIGAHVILVIYGYSGLADSNVWNQYWQFVLRTPWMLPALAGLVLMVVVGVTSYKRARQRMTYETWWLIHMYSYIGIAIAFMHQIDSGVMFLNNDKMKNAWIVFYASVFGAILVFRWIIPFVRSRRHDLRVEKVVRETRNTISVVVRGRDVSELNAKGGQFFGWRFLDGKHWWESHPYSLSASPRNDRLRVTIKDLGDASEGVARLKPGKIGRAHV